MRDRNDEVESLSEPHELEVLLDRERVELFTVKPPRNGATHQNVDAHLKARIKTTAGPHNVGVTFLAKSASLLETNAAAAQCPFQLLPASAHRAGRLSGFDHRPV